MIYKLFGITDNNNLFPWIKENLEVEKTIFNGVAIFYKEKKYIFSIAHKLNPTSNIYLINDDKDFELKLLHFNKDLDITIFTTDLDLDYYILEDYKLNFNKDIIFRSPLNYKEKNIILNFNEIISTNIRILAPAILIINTFINIESDIIDEGCSGLGIIDHNEKYIGLISNIEDKKVNIIPLINYLIFIDYKKSNLCYFYNELRYNKNNLIISKVFDEVFKKKDIIISIDDNKINNYNIYCEILDIDINIDIYILLFKNNDDVTNFEIIRNKHIIEIDYINKSYNNIIQIKDIYNTEIKYKNKNIYNIFLNINLLEYYLENSINMKIKHPKNFIENIQKKKKLYKFDIYI